eukprot:CAMPEP_0204311344 /NCGR_PEP_ID=MMETSP0469-20131031/2287_1 /ASSEMBLY_ACC=CAM_ASM_000384 /TAXON_ID=2969 /ORGANISM="Oxyrrhis marina" /LENGTH=182 /DNA_ID=CAMNT_0051291285 /DNA_START=174 /DNA_END=722 /DNA_ORIENTATION=-
MAYSFPFWDNQNNYNHHLADHKQIIAPKLEKEVPSRQRAYSFDDPLASYMHRGHGRVSRQKVTILARLFSMPMHNQQGQPTNSIEEQQQHPTVGSLPPGKRMPPTAEEWIASSSLSSPQHHRKAEVAGNDRAASALDPSVMLRSPSSSTQHQLSLSTCLMGTDHATSSLAIPLTRKNRSNSI